MFLSEISAETASEETSDVGDDDVLSLTSTVQSEPQVEYPLEGILAERVIAGVREYLVKWDGYPDERCTWEPEENFQNDSTLPEWIRQKARIEEGTAQPYDVEALEARIENWKHETLDRKARRRRRRLKLSVATNLTHGEDYLENEAFRSVTSSSEGDDDSDRHLNGNETGRRNSPRRRRYKKYAHSRAQVPGSERDIPQSLVVKLKYAVGNKAGSNFQKIASPPNDDEGLGRSIANASPPDRVLIVDELRTDEPQKIPKLLQRSSKTGQELPSIQRPKLVDKKISVQSNHVLGGHPGSQPAPKAASLVQEAGRTQVSELDTASKSKRRFLSAAGKGRGPARLGLESTHKKPCVTGAAVLSNWAASLKPRKRSLIEPGSIPTAGNTRQAFRKLSVKRRVEKAGRNEPPPNPSQLTFISLKDGKAIPKSLQEAPRTPVSSKTPFQLIQDGLSGADNSPRADDLFVHDNSVSMEDNEMPTPIRNDIRIVTDTPMIMDVPVESPISFGRSRAFSVDVDRSQEDVQKEVSQYQIKVIDLANAPKGPKALALEKRSDPYRASTTKDVMFEDAITDPAKWPSVPSPRTVRFDGTVDGNKSSEQTQPTSIANNIKDPSYVVSEPPRQRLQLLQGDWFSEARKRGDKHFLEIFGDLIFGLDHNYMGQVRFRGLNKQAKHHFLSIRVPPRQVYVWCKHICTARDYQAYFHEDGPTYYGAGHIAPWPQTVYELELVANTLKLHDGGGIFFTPHFTLLIYPAGRESWKFLDAVFPSDSQEADLRFVMRTPIPELLQHTILERQTHSIASIMEGETSPNALFRQYFGIDYARLVPPAKKKSERSTTFFLMYPAELQEEHEVLIKFLNANNATIYSSAKTGSWDYFTNAIDAGVVLIHDSFIHIHQIPHLARILKKPISIFTINLRAVTPSPSLIRIFPLGAALLLTDSLFLNHPNQTVRILKWFRFNILHTKPSGTWKLASRPHLTDWILSIVEDRAADDGKVYMEIYEQLYHLLPIKTMDEIDDFNTPKDGASLVSAYSIRAYDLDVGLGAKKIDSNAMAANDEALAQWFAGWSRTKVEYYRKFHIVHGEDEEGVAIRDRWMGNWRYLLALTTEEFMKIHRIEQWETDEEVRLAKKERAREARKATAVTVSETIAPRVLVK